MTSSGYFPSALRSVCLLLCCHIGTAGCGLITQPLTLQKGQAIPRLTSPPDSVGIDIVYVERPVGDPLLGSALWQQVDEVSSIDTATRDNLRQHGLRTGVVGSHPPDALQTMLGMKSDIKLASSSDPSKSVIGRHLVLRSGHDGDIQTSPVYERCSVVLHSQGANKVRDFEQARCQYKVTATRLEDGWARLDFVPEIHHGDPQMRHVATDLGWELRNSQHVETFYPMKFSVNLSLGEMVIISSDEQGSGELGHLFFRGAEDESPIQRMLVIRLSAVDTLDNPFEKAK